MVIDTHRPFWSIGLNIQKEVKHWTFESNVLLKSKKIKTLNFQVQYVPIFAKINKRYCFLILYLLAISYRTSPCVKKNKNILVYEFNSCDSRVVNILFT